MCFVHSLLQGAWLCLLWWAGRDCDGSAVRQGPGRPLLCQPGPQQGPDGHISLDLVSAPNSHYSPPACLPSCQSTWCKVSETSSTSTWTDPQPLACWADLHRWPLENRVRRSDYSKEYDHEQTTQPSVRLGTAQWTFTMQNVYFLSVFREMSRTQRLAAPLWGSCCIYKLDPHSPPH